jgi:hypothetical protein
MGRERPVRAGLAIHGEGENDQLDHVFGGGGTAGPDPFHKARQHAGAATPEAPRTRSKDQARPARSKLLQGMN